MKFPQPDMLFIHFVLLRINLYYVVIFLFNIVTFLSGSLNKAGGVSCIFNRVSNESLFVVFLQSALD